MESRGAEWRRERRRNEAGTLSLHKTVGPMSGTLLIMIVDEVPDRAQKLKSLIEFLDVPQVQIAPPDGWLARLGDRRLAGIFVSNDLDQQVVHEVIRDVGEHDPNVPIVMVENRQGAERR